MNDRAIGWIFVGVQVLLLGVLIVLPGADDWSTPSWLNAVGFGLVALGITIAAVSGIGLGGSLTPTPVPVATGTLATTGLYGLARHPIYSGVLVIVVGVVIRSGSIATAAVGIATFVFFSIKARWEEKRLRVVYPAYDDYAASTRRFFPY